MQVKTLIVVGTALVAAVLALITSSAPRAAGGTLIAAYSFNEGGGATVHDSSSSGNNGVATDATWAAGNTGGALSFNGTSSWVTVPDSATLDLTSGFTLEAWVKPAAAMGTAWETIMFKERPGDPVYALYANSDTGAPASVMSTTTAITDARDIVSIQPGIWTHLASTWAGSTLRFFVNGTQVGSRSVTGTLPVSTGALRLGGNGVRGEYFNGLIDDVRIYTRSMSAANIAQDMNTPVAPPAGDITPPTAPGGLTSTNVSATSISASWTASTDNVGVSGYHVFLDGALAQTTILTSFTAVALTCGTSHTIAVEAFDAAGNLSTRPSITVSTLACSDTSAPTAPGAFAAGATTASSIATSWTASTDNVGVAGYTLYSDGISQGTTTGTTFTFSGLTCGASHLLGVEAFDAAGNVSARSSLTASTAACADATPPSAPTGFAKTGGTTTSISASWSASTDNVGVTGYSLFLDGVSAGTTTTTSFTFTGMTCGTSHTLGAQAFDAAGNVSTRTNITASTAACPDTTAPTATGGAASPEATTTTLGLSWTASTVNVGVTGPSWFPAGVSAGSTTTTSFSFTGMTCGTSHTLGVQAFDAAGNVSARTNITASTAACPDTTAPTAPT